MSQIRNLRITLALTVVAIAAFGVPSAQASPVCNQAGNGHHDGALVATDNDSGPAVRHTDGLSRIGSGLGKGLDRAAQKSSALSQCSLPTSPPPPDDGGGDTTVLFY